MKVLFLQNIDGIAGSENYFLSIIPALHTKGVEVEICCVVKTSNTKKAAPFLALLAENNITYHVVKCSSYASPFIPVKINRFVRKNRVDILHCHLIYADFWGASIKQFLNKKLQVISTKHGYHEATYVKYCTNPKELPKNVYYYIFKWSHKRMDASYACSHGLENFYLEAGLIKPTDMLVIQHGFDYPMFEINEEKPYRFSANQLIITGRLIERKGHHFILSTIPQLVSIFPDLVLVILGTGELEKSLKAQVTTLRIEKYVKFMGFQSNVQQFLHDSDVMLITSYSEGLPLVIFEAFNAKTPVITFNTIGSNELVIDKETGLVIPAFDVKKLAEGIAILLNDKVYSQQLANKAQVMLKTKFSLKRMTDETYAFYSEVLRSKH